MATKRNGNGNGRLPLAEWRGGVTATLDALGSKLDDFAFRIESTLKTHAEDDAKVAVDLKAHNEKLDEELKVSTRALDARLSTIEKAQSVLSTKVAIYGGLAGSAVGGVVHFLLKALG
jgi:hypothetical protein